VEASETSLTHSNAPHENDQRLKAWPRGLRPLRCSFASLRTTLSGLEKPTCENPNPFANQKVPIKMLPFHGIL
jgi:hypothetical protein